MKSIPYDVNSSFDIGCGKGGLSFYAVPKFKGIFDIYNLW
jgi:hypothetical protein